MQAAQGSGPQPVAPGHGAEEGAGDGARPGPEESRDPRTENEDPNPSSPDTAQAPASEPSSPSRPQKGSPLSTDAAENPEKSQGGVQDQAAAEEETPPTDRLQTPKEESVVLSSQYRTSQGPGDVVMIQSEHMGGVDVLSAELESADLLGDQRKEPLPPPPPLAPPSIWTFAKMKEFKSRLGREKNSRLVVKRGEVVTVRVPTHPEGKRLFWEFATDDYDIGFGLYFDWTPVTSTAITVQVSESSDEEDEEEEGEIEGLVPAGDVERGSRGSLRNRYGEIVPVYRRDSHREVQAGSHDYPGEGIYLLKFDNSYSLLRNKTLYFHVSYTS
ncbi:protein TMED8 [Ornithorhynchus anatinus]|uniref:Transmembrane p24 trafficking protein family member 8 n=1 Tax=Ornithorhynchus anatinus TaxID=9258 RepID=F6RIN6_ORNAN|nr:protein TMED8 [Ornithorhynchus anatinus]